MREDLLLLRLWRFFAEKRRCSAAETESAFAEGKYVGRGTARLKQWEVSPSVDGDLRNFLKKSFFRIFKNFSAFCDVVTEKMVKMRYNINVINESEN